MRAIKTAVAAGLGVAMFASSGTATAGGQAQRVPLPLNIAFDEALRGRVEESLALSPTLQRQFAVIARTPTVVELRASLAPLPGLRRAETTISRYESGFIRARVLVPSDVNFVELLAHELEHVVEQIEGVDLAALERAGRATEDAEGVFETVRARDAGRAAASEVDQGLRALNAVH